MIREFAIDIFDVYAVCMQLCVCAENKYGVVKMKDH